MGKIILFYKYVQIEYPKQILKWQEKICSELGLKGRIILGHEGINATLGGSESHIERYKQLMNNHPLFGGIDFKESNGDDNYFPRLRIVIKKEIVNLGLDPSTITADQGGIHVTPEQAHKMMAQPEPDLVILDCRNNFETKIGTFINSIRPDTTYFREFPKYVDEHQDMFKNKKVLMACTGGIRCERASAYLKSKGVAQEVYQIQGGIHRYAEQFPDGFFRGKNYVFDARVSVPVTSDILASCDLCARPYDEYANCMNAECNKQFIGCPTCLEQYQHTCGAMCQELVASGKVAKRPARIKV